MGDDNSAKSGEKKNRGLADIGKDWLLRRAGTSGVFRRGSTLSDDDSSKSITQDGKRSKGLADKGKDWVFGAVSGVVSGQK